MATALPAKVKFELVSPEKILVSEDVDMVVVPGTEGYFGVLPGHAPLISSIRPGTIDVYAGKTIAERIFVAGGFAEVTTKRCTVLADEAIRLAALDRSTVEAELADAKAKLPALRDGAEQGEAEKAKLRAGERALAVAQAKLDALSRAADH
ncbi:MAG: ATP synthase F1 subunit epsilon [Aliidongia sp.]